MFQPLAQLLLEKVQKLPDDHEVDIGQHQKLLAVKPLKRCFDLVRVRVDSQEQPIVLFEDSHIAVYLSLEESGGCLPFAHGTLKHPLGLCAAQVSQQLLELADRELLVQKPIAEVAVGEYAVYATELPFQLD